MRAIRLLTAAALVGLATVLPITATAQERAKTADVDIVDFDFDERSVTVGVGTTVTWTNTGERPHTVTDRGGTFDEVVDTAGKTSISFTVPGTYSYFCRINPSRMNGTLVVEPGDTPAKVNRIQALDPAREGAQLSFDPKELTVEAGSTILFANVGGKPHTLTADVDGDEVAFDTGVVTPGAENGRFAGTNASISLPEPGEYRFHCEVHPAAMQGVLTVTGEAKKAPAAASAAPRSLSLDMEGIAFKPPEVSVAPEGKVTWKNLDSAPHDAKFDDVDIQTKLLDRGQSASITAPKRPGSYSYFCSVHPKMRAVLVVVGQNTGDPTGGAGGARSAAAVGGGGPGDGVTFTSILTGVIGAFLGGFGIAAFLVRRRAMEPAAA